ncbi:hypothetical protein RB195_010385 [Necator americanus]|uniref:Reverse transcriptase domain-containing protein n=1 Tax=Necator americanus TaxID=51031 RepID=A0ABR1CXQ3_NECAM
MRASTVSKRIQHELPHSRFRNSSREYKMPLCLTFIDLKKAFDSVETEAVMEALDNQGIPTNYIKVSDTPFSLNATNISECTSHVYLGRELNMTNDPTPELGRRRRAAWGAYKSIEDVVKKTRNILLRAHLFNSSTPPYFLL